MTIEVIANGDIRIVGECPIEDAELLLQQLSTDSEAVVDWRRCRSIHTAVLQVLLAARPKMVDPPDDDFLRAFLQPLLNAPK